MGLALLATCASIAFFLVLRRSIGPAWSIVAMLIPFLLPRQKNGTWSDFFVQQTRVRLALTGHVLQWTEERREFSIATRDIRGISKSDSDPAIVEIRFPEGEPVRLVMALDDANALVARLGLSQAPSRRSYRIASPPARLFAIPWIVPAAILGQLLLGRFFAPSLVASLAVLTVALTLLLLGGDIEIGEDGFVLRSLFGQRLVTFSDVAAISPSESGIGLLSAAVLLRDGSRVVVPIAWGKNNARFDTVYRALLASFERAQMREREPRPASVDLLAASSPNDRARIVGSFRAAGASYRAAGLSPDDLRAIMLDTRVEEETRVAALAIAKDELPEDERVRVRAAFEASVSPKLRVAAGEVLDADSEEAIGAALRKMG